MDRTEAHVGSVSQPPYRQQPRVPMAQPRYLKSNDNSGDVVSREAFSEPLCQLELS